MCFRYYNLESISIFECSFARMCVLNSQCAEWNTSTIQALLRKMKDVICDGWNSLNAFHSYWQRYTYEWIDSHHLYQKKFIKSIWMRLCRIVVIWAILNFRLLWFGLFNKCGPQHSWKLTAFNPSNCAFLPFSLLFTHAGKKTYRIESFSILVNYSIWNERINSTNSEN